MGKTRLRQLDDEAVTSQFINILAVLKDTDLTSGLKET